MTETSPNSVVFGEEPWAEVVLIYRRMCVLRSQGREVDADRLENRDLPRVIADAKLTHGAESLTDEILHSLWVREKNRVADAEVLVELLAPALADRLGASHPASAATLEPSKAVVAPLSLSEPKVADLAPPPEPPPRARTPPAAAPTIADMLDEMLAQERAPRPPRTVRRAS